MKKEEWMEETGDGNLRCIPCGKVCTDEHLQKDDHKNRVQAWLEFQETKKSGYKAPLEEHLAWVPCNLDDPDPNAERWKKCLLCQKFCQDDYSHAGTVKDLDPSGSKEHLKNLRNYEWYKDVVERERLRWHPETARAAAAPTQSRMPKAAPASYKAAAPALAPWAKAASQPAATQAAAATDPWVNFGKGSATAPLAAKAAPAPAAKAAPAAAALPEGWTQEQDTDGSIFYWNNVTNETQWERPEAALPDGWGALKDDDGSTYYHHKDTGKTQWDRPTSDTPITVEGDLPPGWSAAYDNEQGATYYYNEEGDTTWERPQTNAG